ncbi:response regulator [Deltaproteobacteria bacterium TL4]
MIQLKMLLIDDDRTQYLVLQKLCRKFIHLKIEMAWVESYAEGLEAMAQDAYDVYLVDYLLGSKKGTDLIKNAIQSGLNKTMILLTANDSVEVDQEALEAGAADYLVKEEINPILIERSIRYALKRKKIETRLKNALKQAEAANKAKSQFLSMLSHEIRTPLNSIIGFSQLLLEKGRQESVKEEEYQHFLNRIHENGETLAELLNNVLGLAQIETNQMQVTTEPLHLKLLTQTIFKSFQSEALTKNQKLFYDYNDAIPEIIISDRSKINKILSNLLNNALKFTPEGKRVWMKITTKEGLLVFHIEDEGLGIPVEKQKTIFQLFEQVDGSNTRQYEGCGLGLAMTQQLTNLLGGTLTVQSCEGEGSVFLVKIPLVELESEIDRPLAKDVPLFASNQNILVIDDNRSNQELIQLIFQNIGLNIHQAYSGSEGVSQAIARQPDLILMDIHMPGMNGIEATRQIRQHFQNTKIPIVALSAESFQNHQEKAREVGIEDYLLKPLQLDQLMGVLTKYLT